MPLAGFDALKMTAERRVSHREGNRRRLHLALIRGDQARIAGLDVRTDANATQYPVNHIDHGHGRPPTIKRDWTGRRRVAGRLSRYEKRIGGSVPQK